MAIVKFTAPCLSPSVTSILVVPPLEFMSLEAVLSQVWSTTNEDKSVADATSIMQTMRQNIKLLRRMHPECMPT